jgi:hypothetical protein
VRSWQAISLLWGAIVGGIATLSYSGFCFSSYEFLSDEEAINAAIDDVMSMGVHIVENPRGDYAQFFPEKQVRYTGREEFRRLNPDCCKIVPHDRFWIEFRHELFGLAAKSVRVHYMVRYIAESGAIAQQEAGARRAVGNCGRVLNIR